MKDTDKWLQVISIAFYCLAFVAFVAIDVQYAMFFMLASITMNLWAKG